METASPLVYIAAQHAQTLFIGGPSHYLVHMSGFFFIAMIVAMLATLAILIVGMVAMTRGGAFNEKYGNKLMRARVFMQGIALACFALAVLSQGQ